MVSQLLVALLLFTEPSFISSYNNQNEIEKLCFTFKKKNIYTVYINTALAIWLLSSVLAK